MPETPELELRIRDNAESVIGDLNSLATALAAVKENSIGASIGSFSRQLQKVVDVFSGGNASGAVERITKFTDALERLQNVGTIKVKVSNDLKKTSGVDEFYANVKTATEKTAESIGVMKSEMVEIEEGFQDCTQSAAAFQEQTAKTSDIEDRFGRVISTIDDLNREFETTGDEGVKNLSVSLSGLTSVAKSVWKELSAFGSVLSGIGKGIGKGIGTILRTELSIASKSIEAAKRGISGLASVFSNLKDKIGLGNSGLWKLFSSIKRIAMYRLIRSAIKMVTDGVKEGIDNLYKWSSAMNGSFAQAMDIGSNAALKFKNSIGAMLSPVIEAVIPLLVKVSNVAIRAANAINQFFSSLFGRSTWTYATDVVANANQELRNTGSSARQADKEIKGLLADWDELNIIQNEPNDSGSSGGGIGSDVADQYADMFATAELPTNQWTKLADQIRDAILKGDWAGIGKAISDKLDELVEKIDAYAWAEKLKGWIVNALDMANSFLSETDFVAIGTKIGDFLVGIFRDDGNGIWSKVGTFAKLKMFAIIDTMKGVLRPELFLTFGDALARLVQNFFDFDEARINTIADVLGGAINGIGLATDKFIHETDFEGIGTKVGEILKTTFIKIDWTGIGRTLREGIVSIFKLINGVLFGNDSSFDNMRDQLSSIVTPDKIDEMIGDAPKTGFGALGDDIAKVVTEMFHFSEKDIQTIAKALGGSITMIAEEAKSLFKKTDFEGIGTKISGFLKEIFGKGNGGTIDWAGIGETLKEGVIAPFKLLAGIFGGDEEKPEDFPDIGGAIAEMVNGFFDFDKDDIDKAAKAVGGVIANVFTNVKNAIEKTDWDAIIAGFGQFLADLDWEAIFTTAKDAIIAAATTVFNSLDTLWRYLKYILHNAFGGLINSFMEDTVPIFETIEDYEAYTNSPYGLKYGFRKNESGKYEIDTDFSANDSIAATALENFNNALLSTGSTFDWFIKALDDPDLANTEGIIQLKELYDTYKKWIAVSNIEDPFEGITNSAESATEETKDLNEQLEKLKNATVPVEAAVTAAEESEEVVTVDVPDQEPVVIDLPVSYNLVPDETSSSEQLFSYDVDTGDANKILEPIREAFNDIDSLVDKGFTDDQIWETIAETIKASAKASGFTTDASEALADSLKTDWDAALNSEDWDGSVQEIMDKIKQAISEPEEWNIPSVDDSGMVNGLSGTATNIESLVGRIRGAIKSLDGLSFNFSGGLMGGGFKVVMPAMAAEGGMFTTGQMFIARERGPEIVGTMNGKSTVANNNQIVSGISAGVATANQEEVRTLNRIEALLNRIEKKEFAAKVVPSSGFGKDVRRSLDMYARNTGVSG